MLLNLGLMIAAQDQSYDQKLFDSEFHNIAQRLQSVLEVLDKMPVCAIAAIHVDQTIQALTNNSQK
ncbi:hypothetical protein AZE99_02870 [Sphingorhabdus sp. M41]|nr:hypothetical protein AZE99_02870 [Sphingorhabdus sp. M41]